MIDHLNQQNALLSSQAELTVKLSSSEQELVKWRQRIADLESDTTIIEINPGSEIASLTPGRNNHVDGEKCCD